MHQHHRHLFPRLAPARRRSWLHRAALCAAALAALATCSGDDGGGTAGARLSGRAYWSGPVRGATVVVHQLVDGQRTFELARTTTGDDGAWTVTHDGYEAVAIEVIGGAAAEAAGGAVALDGGTVLDAVALELAIGEVRTGVVVSPVTHLVAKLGRARWQAGKEATFNLAVAKAHERMAAHLGFDPIRTPVAAVSAAAGSPTDSVKYGLVLAGLSELAAQAAADQGVTVQSVNTVELTKVLARDAGSAEALFDGNGAEPLYVGASCPPPAGCAGEGPGCYASCSVHTNTLRSRLGSSVLAFLLTPENGTTLGRDDVAPWLEAMRSNVDGELFGTEATEPFDSIGPTITWVAPAAGAMVAGSIAVEVTAADPVGVASLTVTANLAEPVTLVDTDPSPGRFAATYATAGLPEGGLTLAAEATDSEGNVTTSTREVVVNNLAGGTVSGLVYKGRVAGATVRVYAYASGVRGALLGQDTTTASGAFNNVAIADGYSGPLLVEAGFGGTYPEEAGSATVTLDVSDRLRTVVPSYADGDGVANLVVTPLTSFAVTYLEYLQGSGQGGATVAARWATARGAMEASFGVANVYDLTPLAPAEMTTFNAAARAGLVLVGLSETARQASTLGGGDGGTFGTAMTAVRVVRVLEQDLADGCWDGRLGSPTGPRLYYGGTQAVSERAVRRELANAIASYLGDGARNQTPYAGAADVLGLLDTLAGGGGNAAPGACSGEGAGKLHPDAGSSFDQAAPVVTFVTPPTPPAGLVRGTITVSAVATDNLDQRPSLRFTAPAGTADADGDETDADAQHTFVTTSLADGPLVVSLEAADDAGNVGTASRSFTVDNTPPVIQIAGVADGAWYASARTVTFTHDDAHPGTTTATLNGSPLTSGAVVSTEGQKVLVVTATDAAGNQAVRTVTFYLDLTSPTLALVTAPPPTWLRGQLDLTVAATDTLQQFGALGTDIAVTATGPQGAVTPTLTYPATGDGSRRVRVQVDTAAIDDAQGGGTLTLRFDVSDRAGRAATQLVVSRLIDNQPPVVTLLPVRNQAGAMIDGYVNEATATLRGTVTAGGSPTTVAVTVTPGGTAMVTPDAAGNWSHTTGALAEGSYAVSATASDEAGNAAVAPAAGAFVVDRTGPTVTYRPSEVLDERLRCTVTVNALTDDNGTITNPSMPVTYTCSGAATDLSPGGVTLRKYVARLGSLATNPIGWKVSASDSAAGVGVANAVDTVRFQVYRSAPGPTWVNATPEALNGSTLDAAAYVLAGDWPELLTHTATFTVAIQARDRLGNWGPAVTRTWGHVPLAHPVKLERRGNAPTSPADPVYAYSLHRHSLFPGTGQTGPATAMSTGLPAVEPRAVLVFDLVNPHDEPVNVGFFLPVISGATYTKRVWDTSPWIAATSMTNPNNGTCTLNPWPSTLWSARVNHSAPYNCNTGSCTCNGAGWNQPADSLPGSSTLALPDGTIEVRAVDWTVSDTPLPVLGLTSTVNGRPFYEFTIPARPEPTRGRRVRVLVGLPNLDFFAPYAGPLEGVQESDGLGSEQHRTTSGYVATMTATFYERWAACHSASGGTCTAARVRRHLRALVEARVSVPLGALQLNVRQRATNATTALPEEMQHLEDNQIPRRNTAAFLWETCESPAYAGGLSCTPNLPTTTNSAL